MLSQFLFAVALQPVDNHSLLVTVGLSTSSQSPYIHLLDFWTFKKYIYTGKYINTKDKGNMPHVESLSHFEYM